MKVLRTHQILLDQQRSVVSNRQHQACNGPIFLRLGLPFAMQGFDLAQPGLDGVVLFGLRVGPVLTVIQRRQFFIAGDETLFLGK